MESEIKYIDELTKHVLADSKIETDVTWDEFYQINLGKLKPKTNFVISSSVKKVSVAVISLSLATVGVMLYTSSYKTTGDRANYAKVKNENYTNDTLNTKSTYVINKQKEEKVENDKENKDVIIKIKVPVHKKVKIRKQIIIDDSI